MDPQRVAASLPRSLLSHPSSEVRRRALTLVARSLDPNVLAVLFKLLTAESAQVRSEAINIVAPLLREADIPAIRPLLKSPEAQIRRTAIRLMLHTGDAQTRSEAFAAFRDLVMDFGPEGEKSRIEAARVMGEVADGVFAEHLIRFIRDDPAPAVIREAMAAAAVGKYPGALRDVISRLSDGATRAAAREALIQYGEMAVRPLRNALADSRVSRAIRLHIPRTLSKIHAQAAMNALHGGLLDEERSIRFEVILALKEMARRFPDLTVDRQIIESSIMSDAQLYFRRFVLCFALFNHGQTSDSLLYHALTESMERVRERVMWLLSLIYPGKDIRPAWSGLNSPDPLQRAHATEFLDNLLAGTLKSYVFPLYSDRDPDQRLAAATNSLGIDFMDADSALRTLLAQDDRWVKMATIWEIGQRRVSGFRDDLLKLADVEDAVLRETAHLALKGLEGS
jgi:HEAT repeat protein